jgi:hypothetical protein
MRSDFLTVIFHSYIRRSSFSTASGMCNNLANIPSRSDGAGRMVPWYNRMSLRLDCTEVYIKKELLGSSSYAQQLLI